METPELRRNIEEDSPEERQDDREVSAETASIPETEDGVGKHVGI
jgi:hypothetical protein